MNDASVSEQLPLIGDIHTALVEVTQLVSTLRRTVKVKGPITITCSVCLHEAECGNGTGISLGE